MPLLAIPNVSAGRDAATVARLVDAVTTSGARVLDVHRDPDHDRAVITATAETDTLIESMVSLAGAAARLLDLRTHTGIHPRLGALDVVPFVAHELPSETAVQSARRAGRAIGARCELPVYLYGDAALRPQTRDLPALRKGGLDALVERAITDLPPDHGPTDFDPRWGAVCVGARGPLIAFNVFVETDLGTARRLAAAVRTSSVRALGLQLESRRVAQVSMNLVDPATTGIDEAFEKVEKEARARGVRVTATEIVGLVPARFLPPPDAKAARLLIEPSRSLEAVLGS